MSDFMKIIVVGVLEVVVFAGVGYGVLFVLGELSTPSVEHKAHTCNCICSGGAEPGMVNLRGFHATEIRP